MPLTECTELYECTELCKHLQILLLVKTVQPGSGQGEGFAAQESI